MTVPTSMDDPFPDLMLPVARGHVPSLRLVGQGIYAGFCPFGHSPSAPVRRSLRVSAAAGWFCNVCGRNGDVIAFMMAAEDIDFCHAVQWLSLMHSQMCADDVPVANPDRTNES